MDKYVIINMNLFTMNNQVLIIENDNVNPVGAYTLEELPNVVSTLAHDQNIGLVKIAGAAKYAKLVEYGIETAEMSKYNERKIKIEVM